MRCCRASEPWCDRTSDLAGELVQRRGQPLGDAPAVDEDQRRACAPAPARAAADGWRVQIDVRTGPCDAGPLGISSIWPILRHVLDRHFDGQLELLLLRRVDDRDGAELRAPRVSAANSSWIASSGSAASRSAGRGAAFACRPASRVAGAGSAPPRKRATSSSGRCVADRPMRCTARRRLAQASRGAPATAPGARRAWSGPARGSRR